VNADKVLYLEFFGFLGFAGYVSVCLTTFRSSLSAAFSRIEQTDRLSRNVVKHRLRNNQEERRSRLHRGRSL